MKPKKKKRTSLSKSRTVKFRLAICTRGKRNQKQAHQTCQTEKKNGSQAANNQKQLLQSIQNCGCARTDTRTKKKKKTKKEFQQHAFHFSESSFLFPFSFSNFPSQWLASSLHFSKYCLRKKKKRCCDPSRKGTPHCRARKQHMNRASWNECIVHDCFEALVKKKKSA